MTVKYAQLTTINKSLSKIEFLIDNAVSTFTVRHLIDGKLMKHEVLASIYFENGLVGFQTQVAGDLEVLINGDEADKYFFEFSTVETPNDVPFIKTEQNSEEIIIYYPYIEEDLVVLEFLDSEGKQIYIDKGFNPYLYTSGPFKWNGIVVNKLFIYPEFTLYRVKETIIEDDYQYDDFFWYPISGLGEFYIRMKMPNSPFTNAIVKKIQSDKLYSKTYGEMFQV